MDYINRSFELPKQSCFLFGPRGTGKSTLMLKKYPDALYIDLLKPDTERQLNAMPERLFELVTPFQGQYIIIDEIQQAPLLLSAVHRIIEHSPQYNFILTGSSPRKLKRTGADLLGGRAVKRCLHPFIAAELNSLFNLETALKQGLLPLVFNSQSPNDTLNAYISLYLKEEIQAEDLVRNLGNFSRFLEVVSFSHGSILNITNIARECEVKRKTVENYIEILEDLLLAYKLPVFTRRAQRELVAHPKFYLFDAGVYRALRPTGPLDSPDEISGAALEGLVAQHLTAWCDYNIESYQLAYWRTRAGVEVDFIVYGENAFWAIDVKLNHRIQDNDFKGIKKFQEDYPIAKGILLYCGNDILVKNNILCLPCEKFLKWLTPGIFDITKIK